MNILLLWHGTNKQNHKKILKSGKLLSGSWLTDDEKVARRFGLMTVSRTSDVVVMLIAVDADKLYFNGYYCTKQDLYFKDSIYQ